MKRLAVIVTTAPNNHLTETALQLIAAAIEQNITLIGVFFYQEGVLNASEHLSLPSDEYPLLTRWEMLNHQHKVPLYLCSTAAEKHGLVDENNQDNTLIHPSFIMAGLGELVELHNQADRVLQL